MNYVVTSYLLYLLISIALTIWVARTLHANGRIFLVDNFAGNEELADSVNHLLLVGFYLVNIGFVTLALKTAMILESMQDMVELLSTKVGIVLLVLGMMHFFNLLVFSRMRRRTMARKNPPPVAPALPPRRVPVQTKA